MTREGQARIIQKACGWGHLTMHDWAEVRLAAFAVVLIASMAASIVVRLFLASEFNDGRPRFLRGSFLVNRDDFTPKGQKLLFTCQWIDGAILAGLALAALFSKVGLGP